MVFCPGCDSDLTLRKMFFAQMATPSNWHNSLCSTRRREMSNSQTATLSQSTTMHSSHNETSFAQTTEGILLRLMLPVVTLAQPFRHLPFPQGFLDVSLGSLFLARLSHLSRVRTEVSLRSHMFAWRPNSSIRNAAAAASDGTEKTSMENCEKPNTWAACENRCSPCALSTKCSQCVLLRQLGRSDHPKALHCAPPFQTYPSMSHVILTLLVLKSGNNWQDTSF